MTRTTDYRADRVSAGAGSTDATSTAPRAPHGTIVVAERLEIRIVSGEGAVLRVERDGAFEMRDGLGVLAALRVGDGEHVEGVVVVGVFVAHEAQMCDRLVVLSAVDGERRRVQAFVDGLRAAPRGVAWRWQTFR